jgi:AraC-like DNA-binding protein
VRVHHAQVLIAPVPGVYGTRIDSDRHFGRHWHDAYGFGLLEQGAQAWRSDRGVVYGYPGDVISTNPGEVHDGRPHGGPTRRWRIVFVDVETMMRCTDQLRASTIAHPVLDDPALRHQLRCLFRRMDRAQGVAASLRAEALAFEEALVEACVRLLRVHGTAAAPPCHAPTRRIARARERLADDLVESPTLPELAALVGLSRYQLLRQFQQAFGVAPHQWLLQCRADRARRLIGDGAALAEAAATCGFADQSHMTRVFGRQFGFTPGAWQKARRRPH